jgi:RNA polymerase-binding transcription factor DksA
MSTTIIARSSTARTNGARPADATRNLPPPRLTPAQIRELESELRLELAALERRLASERSELVDDASGPPNDGGPIAATLRPTDTLARREVVAAALARLAAGAYGTCSSCGAPIPYGRLLVMPEATHCLSCRGRQ